jgi:hypothetical protein
MTNDRGRKVFLWFVLKSNSVYVGTDQSVRVVSGRDAAYCWRALGTDMKRALANVTIDAERNGFPP